MVDKGIGTPAVVYLGLGANLGDRRQNISTAVELLSQWGQVEQLSSVYETDPVGYTDQPRFLNAACRLTTWLSPEELLTAAKDIEVGLGRQPAFPNAPRPIDIDILFYGDWIVNLPHLVIPHPRLDERAFVLVPLAEIAPDLVHPVSRSTVREMADRLGSPEGVTLWNQEARNV